MVSISPKCELQYTLANNQFQPYKTITKMPQEKQRLIVEEENEIREEEIYTKTKSRLIRASG